MASNVASPIAEFSHVTKWYGPVIGVNDVSFQLAPGITGLLGPNGAGKTTLIKLLTGQLHPSLGEILVRGHSAWSAAAKRHIGYCPDVDAVYEEMSGRQFVMTMARLHGMDRHTARERTEAALADVGMSDRADRTLRGCSKGMRQRIKLAQSLVHYPDLLIVDEPLNGIDPVGRRELMEFFRRFRDRGKVVLVSSHILEEMDALADQVIFLGRGRVLAMGTLAEIRQMLAAHPQRVRIKSSQARELAGQLISWSQVRGIDLPAEDELTLQVQRPDEFFRQFAALVVERGIDLASLETTDVSAEAIFDYVMSTGTV
ncbi:MAG TPA: ABC transporter ATP-binding protein [Planctomycetaceae bacterium]|jgi:ABC-2 type transport system ATP-binding protein